jgi:DNA-binding CsgD family transcriptional regulator/PAS domain-containing protein
MVSDSRFVDIVELIYAAAADPAGWQAAIDAISGEFPGGLGLIMHHDTGRGAGTWPSISSNWNPEMVESYGRYYGMLNPWMKNVGKRPVGLSVPAEFMFSREDLLRTEFYNDYLKPIDLMSGVGVTLHHDRSLFIVATVLYPERTAESERDNVELLQRLSLHIRRAMQVNRRLSRANVSNFAAEAALDRIAIGVAVVDHESRIVFANRAADGIFKENDGLSLDRHGGVSARAPEEAKSIHAAVAKACRVSKGGLIQARPSSRISRPSGKTAYSVLVTPVRAERGVDLAIILITDHERGRLPAADDLAPAFGITPAEAKVLRLLVDGHDVKATAGILGITEMTVRTHVKNMFAKMDCTRQTDLVRQVAQHGIWILDYG